jgi:hypothetical protein
MIVCGENNMVYKYSPLVSVEHNYDKDTKYIDKLEDIMNLKANIVGRDDTTRELNYDKEILFHYEKNVDKYCNNETMQFIKRCFWENKDRDHFNNNKINIAVHIRRANHADNGQCGERGTTPNDYYLKLMNRIREKYKESLIQFHIYSQGHQSHFKILEKEDVIFHLDEHITTTFIGLVAADELILSPSSFSYVAGLLSDGIVYYKKFWHGKKNAWNLCK